MDVIETMNSVYTMYHSGEFLFVDTGYCFTLPAPIPDARYSEVASPIGIRKLMNYARAGNRIDFVVHRLTIAEYRMTKATLLRAGVYNVTKIVKTDKSWCYAWYFPILQEELNVLKELVPEIEWARYTGIATQET